MERVLNILDAFTAQEPELTASELGRRVGLNKSTVHRLTSVLEARGLLWRSPKSRAYMLGPGILRYVEVVLNRRDLASVSTPYMVDLRDRTEESVGLHLRVGKQRTCIAQVESPHELRMRLEIGRPLPLYCGAASKVLLAEMDTDEIEEIIRETGLRRLGPGSIEDPETLRKELRRIRANGYAISREERTAGGVTVAAPVRERSGTAVASVSVYGPVVRVNKQRVTSWIPLVVETADSISRELGFIGKRAAAE